jgi:hypothetical protein
LKGCLERSLSCQVSLTDSDGQQHRSDRSD